MYSSAHTHYTPIGISDLFALCGRKETEKKESMFWFQQQNIPSTSRTYFATDKCDR